MKLGLFGLFLFTFQLLAEPGPQRVISLSLASDEILLDLLERCGRSNALLAISSLADDPNYSNISPEAKKVKHRAGSSVEQLLKLNPDLVFAATFNRKELINGLKKGKAKVVILKDFESFKDVTSNISELAKATGCEKAGLQMNTDFEKKMNEIKKLKKSVRLIQYSKSGRIMSGKTTFDAVVQSVGAINIPSQEFKLNYWPLINVEKIIASNPDFIVVFSEEELKSIHLAVGWKELNAVKKGNIILLNPATTQAVSQHLIKAAEELSSKISMKSQN